MKVILTQDIKSLGHKDDVVSVKDGYGRNFLIPQGKAKLATSGALKMLAEDGRQRAYKQDKLRKDAEAIVNNLNGVTVTIKTMAGADGRLFGSVTSVIIAQALKEKGFEVDRRKISHDTIKELGNYTADISLFKDIKATVNLEVVSV